MEPFGMKDGQTIRLHGGEPTKWDHMLADAFRDAPDPEGMPAPERLVLEINIDPMEILRKDAARLGVPVERYAYVLIGLGRMKAQEDPTLLKQYL